MNPTLTQMRDRAVFDRLSELRVILPAMAYETAVARREAARLRVENERLIARLAELQHNPAADAQKGAHHV